jgi:type IV secretory pathway VirD2 relaxase
VPSNEDERVFRIRPPKPPPPRTRNKPSTCSRLFKAVMRYARMTGKKSRVAGQRRLGRSNQPWYQRCAVRVLYSRNAVRGQWGAHGRYLARETRQDDPKTVGFGQSAESIDISKQLDGWQKSGDHRMWKLIISPEFGDRIDLNRLIRDLMSRMESDLATDALEWTAVAHYNTEHPHVHIALRGVDGRGQQVNLDQDYVKSGIRRIAENLCTQQLGYRTEKDAAAAERREVQQRRYTSLDRIIGSAAALSTTGRDDDGFFKFQTSGAKGTRGRLDLREQHTVERLVALQNMGLAESAGPNSWRVRRDFDGVLRAMQRTSDRQKMLASHGIPMSDQRLSVTTLEYRNLTSVEGRVLVHGEEEAGREAGRGYLMLEGTDARVHHIYYTPEMEDARNRGALRTNSFIRLRKLFVNGKPRLEIDDLGDSESVLSNKVRMRQTVRSLIKRGVIPVEDGWGGWLGRYQVALKKMALEELDRDQQRKSERYRDRGRD